MENFKHPYLATNPTDFWRRWHISLSTWFRDYVYIPLGGKMGKRSKVARNLMITFVVSGLWHGASWNFVLWGAFHGALALVYRAAERRIRRPRAPVFKLLGWLLFFFLVNLGWLLFREQDTERLLHLLTLSPFDNSREQVAAAGFFFAMTLAYSLPLILHSGAAAFGIDVRRGAEQLRFAAQAALVCVMVLGLMLFHSQASSEFIYFQF
jgi:D-alanyl-lipoteichoic acid acyltransferase DltB (MBOAT superfamily)